MRKIGVEQVPFNLIFDRVAYELVLDVIEDVTNLVHVFEARGWVLLDPGEHSEEALGKVEQRVHDSLSKQPLSKWADQMEDVQQLLLILHLRLQLVEYHLGQGGDLKKKKRFFQSVFVDLILTLVYRSYTHYD